MRIVFLSLVDCDFNAATPYEKALGGTESAACYLAAELAKLGHETFIFSQTSEPGIHCGVTCVRWDYSYSSIARVRPEVVVLVRFADAESIARALFPVHFVLWAHDNHLEMSTSTLKKAGEREVYSGFAMVSQWQLENYAHYFGIHRSLMTVLCNAISPKFESLFAAGSAPLSHKVWPPIIAYTSAPERGLAILLEIFPSIRQLFPGARLRIHATIQPSAVQDPQGREEMARLLQRCAQTEGVEHPGPVSQGDLANSLKSVSVWAYPNPSALAETSCICAAEAMAAGCALVTTHAAGLPETTAGFAELVSLTENIEDYKREFLHAMVKVLSEFQSAHRPTLSARLADQVAYSNERNTWRVRAGEWTKWLRTLRRPEGTFVVHDGIERWNF